jgi:hypothetical protein
MTVTTEHSAELTREELEDSFKASEATSGPIVGIARNSSGDLTLTEHDFMGNAPATLILVVEGENPPSDQAGPVVSGPAFISSVPKQVAI